MKDRLIFDFEGSLPSSKSLTNRLLILKEFFPKEIHLDIQTQALDVCLLSQALKDSKSKKHLSVGQGGTTLRFLAVFLASQKGQWQIEASESLLKRPQSDLYRFLESQNVYWEVKDSSLILKSPGEFQQTGLAVSLEKTTQVMTAVLLVSLGLYENVEVQKLKEPESGYLNLTLKFLEDLGVSVEETSETVKLEKKESFEGYHLGADWSSASFLFVIGALLGRTKINNLNFHDGQPDRKILDILKNSYVDFEDENCVTYKNRSQHTAQTVSLKKSPDLFPVLSVFFCFCQGETILSGAPGLKYKESNRIEEMHKILSLCGFETEILNDGLKIQGQGRELLPHAPFSYDCCKDHRLFMACYILKKMGCGIEIKGEESIKKSFPEFLEWEKKDVFFNRP